jgi:predicted RNase H-like HicB family nuclease
MNKFAVVIHVEPEGGYWGEVPALPGCYSQGETVDELLANLREAIAGVLEVMREEGRTSGGGTGDVKPIPGPELCRKLERAGWTLKRVRGSHHIYAKTGEKRILSVPATKR